MTTKTFLFDEFFESGKEESISPFLTPNSRRWGKNLSLKSSFIAAFTLICAFVLSFFPSLAPLSHLFLLFTYFFAGVPALIGAIEDIFALEINIDVLMTLAAFLAILIGSGMEGALLLVLFAFSGALEEAVQTRAKGAISALKKLAPTKGWVKLQNGAIVERALQDIGIQDHLLIKAGEIVPLDGKVIEGSSSLNLAHLTGENLPITKEVGDIVPSGALNLEGSLLIEVTATSANSTLAKIIELVTQAEKAKPKLQRWIDTFSNRYAVSIISLSALFALTFPWLFSIPFLGFEGSIYRSLAFLIAASPCALIIAIPIAYLSAISCSAKRGILLKGGIVLDALAACRQIALDKTGTLTQGELACIGIQTVDTADKQTERQALAIAYGLEQNAVHPLAQSIVKYAEEQKLSPQKIFHFRLRPGYGVEGNIDMEGHQEPVFLGSPAFVKQHLNEKRWEQLQPLLSEAQREGTPLALLAFKKSPYLFVFKDKVRPLAKETMHQLKGLNLEPIMLTGDHAPSAKAMAKEVGIEQIKADLRPEDKLSLIDKLADIAPLAMVGDGINDAPALARAHVGISMGKIGSRAAVDASDVVLLQDHLEKLPWLVKKARQTTQIVKQNVSLAVGAILIATLPALLGFIPLWLAVILHEGGTVLVGLNALRLLRK